MGRAMLDISGDQILGLPRDGRFEKGFVIGIFQGKAQGSGRHGSPPDTQRFEEILHVSRMKEKLGTQKNLSIFGQNSWVMAQIERPHGGHAHDFRRGSVGAQEPRHQDIRVEDDFHLRRDCRTLWISCPISSPVSLSNPAFAAASCMDSVAWMARDRRMAFSDCSKLSLVTPVKMAMGRPFDVTTRSFSFWIRFHISEERDLKSLTEINTMENTPPLLNSVHVCVSTCQDGIPTPR